MKKGFSVLELVISLMVIASIMAAFTPLITKKFSSSIFGKGGKVNLTTDCTDKFNEYCTLCDDKRCIRCTLDPNTCANNQYKDTASCSCKDCKETYGEDCEKCNEKKCLTCPSGLYLDSDDNCQLCSDKFNHCASCTENECTSCADGYVLTDPTSNTPCSNFDCSGEDFIQIGNLCITKKNMGDGTSLTIPSGVTVANVNQNCNAGTQKCCWQGATSGTDCNNENGGVYDGCRRTVCDWYAADYICKNFTAGGRTWRLATKDEMSNWATNSKGLGVNGLQLCDLWSGHSSAYCSNSGSCPGSSNGRCLPGSVWSGTVNGSSLAYYYYLNSGSWYQFYDPRTLAFSVRCVAEMPQSCADKISAGCEMCDGNTCLKCASGYVLKNGKCEIDCSTKFGSNCTSCTTSACTACKSGYILSGGSCILDCQAILAQNTFCTGSDFMGICTTDNKPLCVTRKNMGDSSTLPIPSGVTVANVNQTCNSSSSNKCCWKGATSGTNCDNKNGGAYSGCNRTVCDWYAADYICKNFTAGGRTWRLATRSEMSNWDTYSIGKGVNGLQLCSSYLGYSSAYCNSSHSCPGSPDDWCSPFYVWSGTVKGSSYAYYYSLYSGSWLQSNSYRTNAYSVRCVTEL